MSAAGRGGPVAVGGFGRRARPEARGSPTPQERTTGPVDRLASRGPGRSLCAPEASTDPVRDRHRGRVSRRRSDRAPIATESAGQPRHAGPIPRREGGPSWASPLPCPGPSARGRAGARRTIGTAGTDQAASSSVSLSPVARPCRSSTLPRSDDSLRSMTTTPWRPARMYSTANAETPIRRLAALAQRRECRSTSRLSVVFTGRLSDATTGFRF